MRLGYKVLENGLGIVPDRITKIDSLAFYGCKTLRKIRLPDGTVTDAETFTNSQALSINYIQFPPQTLILPRGNWKLAYSNNNIICYQCCFRAVWESCYIEKDWENNWFTPEQREYIAKYTAYESPGRGIWTNPTAERLDDYSAFRELTDSFYEIYFYPERLREAIKKGVIKL